MESLISDKLLDTTLLIDLSRGYAAAADFIDNEIRQGCDLYVSIVSAMELIVGCRNKNEVSKAEKLIADFRVIQLDHIISQNAYELIRSYSKSHGLIIPDALIAATALTESLELISDNERHFKMIPGLVVCVPY